MKPSLRGYTRPVKISRAFVPASIRSSLVRTPMVLRPCGSTARASFKDSELARSTFAAETARITLIPRKVRTQHVMIGDNEPIWLRNIFEHKAPYLTFDIARLVTNGNLKERLQTSAVSSMEEHGRTFVKPGRSTNVKSSTFGL